MRIRQPVAVAVVQVEAVELRQFGDTLHEQAVQAFERDGARAVILDALDHAGERRVGLPDGVVGMLGHRAGEVGRGHRHLGHLVLPRGDAAPYVAANQQRAQDRDEQRHPEGQ